MTRAIAFSVLFLLAALSGVFVQVDPGDAGSLPFVVDSPSDTNDAVPGDNVCADLSGDCTLRAAIQAANGAPEIHDIYFDLPNCPGAGCVLTPDSALPALTRDNSTISGEAHPGFTGEPLVVIDGSDAGAASGLLLSGSNQTAGSLEIRNFQGDGVIPGTIGKSAPWNVLFNYIHDNGGTGVNGELPCLGGVNVIGNSITGHKGTPGVGVSSCGDAVETHYNRIYDNTTGATDVGSSFIAQAQHNWWGCNEGPFDPDCDSVSGPIDAGIWLTLTIEADPISIPGGAESDLTAGVFMDSNGLDTTGLGNITSGTPITLGTDLGSVGSDFVVVKTDGSVAEATLTADEGPGLATLTAELDAETVSTSVTITSAPPTPTPFATATPTTSPTDAPTATPTAQPTGTPTPTATAMPTATPSATPTAEVAQGDVDCDGDVDSVDALKDLRHVAALLVQQNEPCDDIGTSLARSRAGPAGEDDLTLVGDVDCDRDVDSVDALKILRHVASLPVQQTEPCRDVGTFGS